MKKIFFVLQIFATFVLWAQQEKKSSFELFETYNRAEFYFPENFENDFWSDSKYVFSHGFKLRFGGIELRHFNSCSKTLGSDLYKIDSSEKYFDVFSETRNSILVDLKKIDERIDAKIAAGSLAFSSRMKSPALSSSLSPFVSQLSDAKAFYPVFPTKTSSKKDPALFGRATFHFLENFSGETIRFLPLYAEFLLRKNESDLKKIPSVCVMRTGLLYKNFFKATGGLWFERYYAEKTDEADFDWWAQIPVHNSALYNSFMAEGVFAIPHFKSKTIFGITENENSLGRFWFRNESLFKSKDFSLAAQFFLTDNVFCKTETPIVTTANLKKYQLWQAKVVPEFCFSINKNSTLKFGAATYIEEKIQNWQKENQWTSLDLKFATGAKFKSKKNAATLMLSASNIEIRQHLKEDEKMHLPKLGCAAKYSQKFKNKKALSLYANASAQLAYDEDKREYSQNFRAVFYPGSNFLKSVAVGAASQQKKSGEKISPYAKATFFVKTKKVRVNADLKIEMSFKENQ